MILSKITIHKYKSFESDQEVDLSDDITILVGMNESGKTSILEAIAKTNYFTDDSKFKFSRTHDYPRREKKKMDKSGIEPKAITCEYTIPEALKAEIDSHLGSEVFTKSTIARTTKYSNKGTWGNVGVNIDLFIRIQLQKNEIFSETLVEKLKDVKSANALDAVIESYSDESKIAGLTSLKEFYSNEWNWDEPISEYVARNYLKPALPKFLYYDEYYSLPSRIVLEDLENESLKEDEYKTAKALLDLADLSVSDILEADDFEDYIAELEATEATISDELFRYWRTNQNLNVEFKIESVEKKVPKAIKNNYNREEIIDVNIVNHVLDIRVKNQRTRVSLPLKNRSKGFNWFFSFLVWFKKIQEDADSSYVLLLDEPGLNLHASAQADMLRFIDDLSTNYQIIYTTHSPFAIPSDNLDRVRTVLETKDGSIISESIQEKDPNTLFPLQAALGYDIAQNLFVSSKNLLVEGVSDLIILTSISSILESRSKSCLRNDVTIVPTGGLDKVASFISLLRGSKLDIVCLLDSFNDASAQAKLNNMVYGKIISSSKIRFFNEFIDGYDKADLEDMFSKEEYLQLFNAAFEGEYALNDSDLNDDIKQIILQINLAIGRNRFNHYRPASAFAKSGALQDQISEETLYRFERMFERINQLFK